MTKQVYLVLVDKPNETAPTKGNNKYYNMVDNGDGTWTAKYGRVGGGEQSRTYPISTWDKKYHEKLRKGYTDVTELQAVETTKVEIDAEDRLVKVLLEDLYNASKQRATSSYRLASFGSVTQVMLDEAQGIIDEIATQIGMTSALEWYVRKFLELYTIIPRRMDNVQDYLPQSPGDKEVTRLVEGEQDNLESLRGQVVMAQSGSRVSLLDSMGVEIEPVQSLPPGVDNPELRWRRGFKVVHPKTYKAFETFKDLKTKYLYHGSRRTNWLSILQSGLQIRPAANGTNYGNGIYFADDPQKSKQYTDGYMGIYEVAVGQQYRVTYTNSRLNLNEIRGYDSVLADRSYREYVIYRPEQCRIQWLLDVR